MGDLQKFHGHVCFAAFVHWMDLDFMQFSIKTTNRQVMTLTGKTCIANADQELQCNMAFFNILLMIKL